jgi:SAM-dependent methyltransferase
VSKSKKLNHTELLPNGNGYDDLRINLPLAYANQEDNRFQSCQTYKRWRVINRLSFYTTAVLQKTKMLEPLIMCGFFRKWFADFEEYWRTALGGRPLCIADFHALRHHYRTKVQNPKDYQWNDAYQHLENWQQPHNIYSTFSYVYSLALRPIRGHKSLTYLTPGMRVLEYGCSMAPYYRNWKKYYNHIDASWTLMDIANFPFHYARHLYMSDKAVKGMPVIKPEVFDGPIPDGDIYDFIIITTVFEHLHKPWTVARHLLDHLAPGGIFVFDYIMPAEAHELDTPGGIKERHDTLKLLSDNLTILHGSLNNKLHDSVGLCIGRKKV